MSNIQLVINNGSGWKAVDLPTDNSVKFSLYKSVQDFRDPLKATGAVSLPFTLPPTSHNRLIFHNDDDKQKLGKFKGVYQAQLLLDNEVLVDGELTLNKVKANQGGFEVYVGQTRLLAPRLGDVVGDKKLTELKSFQSLPFSGDSTIAAAWNANQLYPATEVCFPHVVRSFAALQTGLHSGYESIGISHYCAAITKAIFTDAGYTVAGDIFDNETFLKLVLLYSNSGPQYWNYGTLATMQAHCLPNAFGGGIYDSGVKNSYERQNDMVQVLCYGWKADAGDLCESLGDDGVYTCKYSGLYTIRVSAAHAYANGATGQGGFTTFRCISDNEFMPDNNLPYSFSSLPALASLDVDTLAVGGDSAFTFTARLTEGKQYQVQRYVQFTSPKTAGDNSFLCYSPNEGNFFITACDGPLTVNPALFLPTMTQQVYLKGIFKLFNLYYHLNEDTKTVTLFGRDDFFQETLQDIVNLSPHLSLDAMEETPFTDEQVAATYVTWAPDESDYILNGTDYLDKVNGVVPSGSTVLPFSPLGYVKVEYSASGTTGTDLIPAIIPYTENVDTSILSDTNATSAPGSWKPRLCLYEGNNWLNPTLSATTINLITVGLGRPATVTATVSGSFTGGGYPYTAISPKITFFNVGSQPIYEIQVNQALRSFSLSGYTGDTIYSAPSSTFLNDVNQVPTLDFISLAINIDVAVNPVGFFSQLYGNDLLIDNLSNYFQGTGRMDSVLWNRLTGRQVLRVAQDLFLLDSITNFDVNAKLATYRLYKLVSNSGISNPATGSTSGSTGSTGTIQYSSTMTATASCPTNTSGTTKTATATRSSYVNQSDADQKAYNAALQLATSQLVCTVTGWVGHGVATATCSQGSSYGYEITATAIYTSSVSQNDADQQAYGVALQSATAQLVCHVAAPAGDNDFISNSDLITSIVGDFNTHTSYADAQAYSFADYTYYFARNQQITVGQKVYVASEGYFFALPDGYYPFKYTVGSNYSVQGFQILNGVVDNYIDNVGAGATA